ncbi:sn-glycerol-3-phosphate ABC transporter ATP-binding protein UgpC [Defluviimonas sp. WL0050]|uniref:Sn-glycerol-3-phosphate ABC transporter ATP-binding protein UgpC n=1 Tax=Albidovulum litorale TaxID=2984134 RepID=A0ABT2ZMJ2_9RHOB|nr:sn-glycerol-3-phosphate ABC transporter ATP-binding protein UgpC [Defluviimonas sp. WL0050]MCV2872287.1 sn-glycerol-3-phosphate ABC transporter ATP-binding protein UgpC [Defluviimonas sp. WL0050]
MSTLDLIGVSKSYGSTNILTSIDISLASGEFLVLLGASGCGKSTILNIIAGLLSPTSGEVRIDGKRINEVHPKNRDIAMVFQSYALYPNLTVERNIGFGLEMRGVGKAERQAAIQKVARILKIDGLLDRKPAQLSGGQRQRVAIGRALVREPKIFLFDEPLSNLDAKLRMEMRAELKRLHRMLGTTVVYVTHDQIEAMTLATRIAVMREGQIEQIGTPEEIYNRPATAFVAEFVGAPPMNMIDATLDADCLQLEGSGQRIALPGKRSRSRQVILGLRPEDLHIADASDELVIDATVDFAEPTGPDIIVFARHGGNPLVASLPSHLQIDPESQTRFSFSIENMHIFDRETGQRIEP